MQIKRLDIRDLSVHEFWIWESSSNASPLAAGRWICSTATGGWWLPYGQGGLAHLPFQSALCIEWVNWAVAKAIQLQGEINKPRNKLRRWCLQFIFISHPSDSLSFTKLLIFWVWFTRQPLWGIHMWNLTYTNCEPLNITATRHFMRIISWAEKISHIQVGHHLLTGVFTGRA